MNDTPIFQDLVSEQICKNAEDVEHIFCMTCNTNMEDPSMCGEPIDPEKICPNPGNCNHLPCSMCELEWKRHMDQCEGYIQ